LGLLALSLTACSSTDPNQWDHFVDPKAGFGMSYPAAWVKTSTKLPTASLAVHGTHEQQGFSCSLYHERYPQLAGVKTRDGLNAISEARLVHALSGSFSQVALSPRPEANLSGLPAKDYQVTYLAGDTKRPYMGQMLVTVANGGFYNFFCGAPVVQFASAGVVVERIRESLVILPLADD
jgi:hypothetical protein